MKTSARPVSLISTLPPPFSMMNREMSDSADCSFMLSFQPATDRRGHLVNQVAHRDEPMASLSGSRAQFGSLRPRASHAHAGGGLDLPVLRSSRTK